MGIWRKGCALRGRWRVVYGGCLDFGLTCIWIEVAGKGVLGCLGVCVGLDCWDCGAHNLGMRFTCIWLYRPVVKTRVSLRFWCM